MKDLMKEISNDYLRSAVIGAGFMTGAVIVIGLLQVAHKAFFA